MTIVGYASTSEFSLQITDRLLSINGKPHDPKAIKSTILDYEGILLQVGFSGLAKVGKFDAQTWILETLMKYKRSKKPLTKLLEYFANQADKEFQSINVADKRFAVILNGILPDINGHHHPDVAIISNGIDFDGGCWKPYHEKKFKICSSTGPSKYRRGFIGTLSAVHKYDLERLENLLDKCVLTDGIKAVMINMIRDMADRKEGIGVIGKDLIWSIIKKNGPAYCGYASSTRSDVITTPNRVFISRSSKIAIKNINLKFSEANRVKLKPNDLCWCSSGKKYKRCHLPSGG